MQNLPSLLILALLFSIQSCKTDLEADHENSRKVPSSPNVEDAIPGFKNTAKDSKEVGKKIVSFLDKYDSISFRITSSKISGPAPLALDAEIKSADDSDSELEIVNSLLEATDYSNCSKLIRSIDQLWIQSSATLRDSARYVLNESANEAFISLPSNEQYIKRYSFDSVDDGIFTIGLGSNESFTVLGLAYNSPKTVSKQTIILDEAASQLTTTTHTITSEVSSRTNAKLTLKENPTLHWSGTLTKDSSTITFETKVQKISSEQLYIEASKKQPSHQDQVLKTKIGIDSAGNCVIQK